METVVLVPVLLISFVVHEFAHAWVANWQGDPTAKNLGRVTLNPIPHIDLFGTILVPGMLLLTNSGFLIGWAKPVPVVARNFRHYRRGDMLTSVAGVTANFILAILCTLLMVGLVHLVRAAPALQSTGNLVQRMLEVGIQLNFLLVVFNLLPVPPLDGSHLVYHLLPPAAGAWYRRMEKWGVLIFIALLLTGAISVILGPANVLTDLSFRFIRWST
jgi:Zn-dependent protease